MALSNSDIADKLVELAELLRHKGENRFKVKAYRTAARGLREFPESVDKLVARGEPLTRVPGVGAGISAAIHELLTSGSLSRATDLRGDLPPAAVDIAGAFGISMRDAGRIIKKLGVGSAAELRKRLTEQGAAELGARLQAKLCSSLDRRQRMLWFEAQRSVRMFSDFLGRVSGVSRVEIAGSYRRGKETVGTLRFVMETTRPDSVRAALREHAALDLLTDTETGATARLLTGSLLSVRFADVDSWGDALVEETAVPRHLNEVRTNTSRRRIPPSATEEEWYAARGLPLIPPELREGRGEVLAALEGNLPKLVELPDMRGDLHAHTTGSDGANSLAEMARAAKAKGYEYLAITDHSKSLKITRGLDEARLAAQGDQIDRMNARSKKFRLLKGSEVDILQDGALDFSDKVLSQLDVVICSIHSRFSLSKEQQTERLIRAIQNPFVTCVGHLRGRLLLKRTGYELDLDAVLAAVKRHRKWLEINSSPDRLDIDDELALRARAMGIPLLINTDAHSTRELEYMAFGVQQARRGWQSRETIVNTLPLPKLLQALRTTRGRPRGKP